MKRNKIIFYIAVITCALILAFVIRAVKKSERKEFVVTFNSADMGTVTTVTTTSTKNLDISQSAIHKDASSATLTDVESETTAAPLYIDINTADIDLLCQLDGIGEALAKAIIRYREQNNGFNNIEEIMNVYGIGEGIFENIRDFIYVENPVYPEYVESSEDFDEVKDEDFSEYVEVDETDECITEPSLTLEEVAPIDINSADTELLLLLPHIDEDKAEKIIELRESLNGFKNTYEILYVEGISREQANEILEFICIGDECEATE